MFERPVGMHVLARLAFDKAVAALAPRNRHDTVVVLDLLAAIEAATAPEVLLELEFLFGDIERVHLASISLVHIIFAFQLVRAHVVVVTAALDHLDLEVVQTDIHIAAVFLEAQAGMPVRLADFEVAHFDFGAVPFGTVLDNHVEIARVRRGLAEEHATCLGGVLAADVLGFLLETGQVGALDPEVTELTVNRDKTRRFARFLFNPGHHFFLLDFRLRVALLVLDDAPLLIGDLHLFLYPGNLLDFFWRNGEFLDPIGLIKFCSGLGFIDLVIHFLVYEQSIVRKCQGHQKCNDKKTDFLQNRPRLPYKLIFYSHKKITPT